MKYIVAADIGGTHCRFGLFLFKASGDPKLINEISATTNEFDSFNDILSYLIKMDFVPSSNHKQKFVIAVPGPVLDDKQISMINVKWSIDIDSLRKKFNQYSFYFLNDVLCHAYGFLTKTGRKNIIKIKSGLDYGQSDIVVVGAGTGLGHSCLKAIKGDYIPLPSEAGHTVFPFINEEEEKFRSFVYKETGEISPTLNAIVSGSGLTLLHRYFTGENNSPEIIVKKITSDSPTTIWFSRFYARCCKNYCLTIVSHRKTLYLTGGIVTKNPFLANNDIFRKEFIYSSLESDLLQNINIYCNSNINIGLWGAAYYAKKLK